MWETRSVFHISMPLLLWQDSLGCRRPVAQRRVRPLRVVFHAPPLRQNLCLLQRVEDLAVQELIAQLPVEALTVPVLPRTPGLNVQRPRAYLSQPLPQLLGNELRPVVRTNVLWDPAHQHHIRQCIDHLQTPQAPRHPQPQALPRILVDQHQDAQRSSIVRHRFHKIVAPHMIRPLPAQPDTRAIVQPQPSPRFLLGGYFQPFAPPDALHAIFPHSPARTPQQRRNPPVAVASVLRGQLDDVSRQCILVVALHRLVALGPAPLLQQPASMAFRQPVLLPRTLHRATTPLRAYKFPEATSFSTCFSSDSSATNRFSREFSFSRSFSRLACSSFGPPYRLRDPSESAQRI